MPVACQSCAPECPQAFGAEGDLPRIISRGMPGARSLRARLRGLNITIHDNLSVICFANATVSLRLSHGAGLTAHRAVIQHRAAASLPYTGEAIRCGGILDIKTDKLLAPARAFRSGQGGRAQAYGLYVKPGQRGHGRKDPAGYQHIRSINHEQKVS